MKCNQSSGNSRGIRLVAVVVFGLLGGQALSSGTSQSWKAPPRAARRKNPIAPTSDSIAAGRAVYMNNCISCHGPSGRGDGPKGRILHHKPRDFSEADIRNQTDGALYWKINEGKPPMPAFDASLNEDDRWNVVNYIRTLLRK